MLDIKVLNAGKEYTIALAGRLDTFSAEEAERVFTEAADKADRITLDCSRLVHVSGEGIRVIKQLCLTMKDKGGILAARNVLPEVRVMFDAVGLTALLEMR